MSICVDNSNVDLNSENFKTSKNKKKIILRFHDYQNAAVYVDEHILCFKPFLINYLYISTFLPQIKKKIAKTMCQI